jgi:hypothetical protein
MPRDQHECREHQILNTKAFLISASGHAARSNKTVIIGVANSGRGANDVACKESGPSATGEKNAGWFKSLRRFPTTSSNEVFKGWLQDEGNGD